MSKPHPLIREPDADDTPLAWRCRGCGKLAAAINVRGQTHCERCGGVLWYPVPFRPKKAER